MATTFKLRRGTTAETAAFTGAEGELFVDIETKKLYLHDGVTQGGIEQMKGGDITFDSLSDITITSAATGQVLTFSGSEWINTAPEDGSGILLDSLSEITITSVEDGQILTFSGSEWINTTPDDFLLKTEMNFLV